jgi:hypothetical protein
VKTSSDAGASLDRIFEAPFRTAVIDVIASIATHPARCNGATPPMPQSLTRLRKTGMTRRCLTAGIRPVPD